MSRVRSLEAELRWKSGDSGVLGATQEQGSEEAEQGRGDI
jgi:hypothetical protein